MAFPGMLNPGLSLSEAAQSGHYVTLPTPLLQIKVSSKDGFVILKVKNKHVEQAEKFHKPQEPDLSCHTGAKEAEGGRTEKKKKFYA